MGGKLVSKSGITGVNASLIADKSAIPGPAALEFPTVFLDQSVNLDKNLIEVEKPCASAVPFQCPVRLLVRSLSFQVSQTGSNPVQDTTFYKVSLFFGLVCF